MLYPEKWLLTPFFFFLPGVARLPLNKRRGDLLKFRYGRRYGWFDAGGFGGAVHQAGSRGPDGAEPEDGHHRNPNRDQDGDGMMDRGFLARRLAVAGSGLFGGQE